MRMNTQHLEGIVQTTINQFLLRLGQFCLGNVHNDYQLFYG